MWKPIRNIKKESQQLIIHYAEAGLNKELNRLNKKIKRLSDSLRTAHDNNATTRRMATMRTNLSIECEQRDRIEKALEAIVNV